MMIEIPDAPPIVVKTLPKAEEISEPEPQKIIQVEKENNSSMNIFGMNLEFGMNTDENIASTLIGVAVKNGDSWRIYDKQKNTLTDVGNMNLGGLPLFIMPATKLEVGDLIKNDGEYCYVIEIGNGKVKTLSAATGKMEEAVPVDNILGIRFYSKIMAVADNLFGDDGDDDSDKLMLAMAMSTMAGGGDGGNVNSMLLPLLLLKDKDGGDSDKKADMLKFALLSSMSGGDAGGQNSMLPLLLLKKDLF